MQNVSGYTKCRSIASSPGWDASPLQVSAGVFKPYKNVPVCPCFFISGKSLELQMFYIVSYLFLNFKFEIPNWGVAYLWVRLIHRSLRYHPGVLPQRQQLRMYLRVVHVAFHCVSGQVNDDIISLKKNKKTYHSIVDVNITLTAAV